MAIIQTPGTNFHDLNLDWLLNQMKNCLAEWASTKEDWEDLKQDNADFKAFVTNYFDNLDLSEEVSAKIDAMVEDGTLLELITYDEGEGSALSDVAAQWLSAHITQETGYVIDDSLTVEGAAADAKATGDAITDLRSAINLNNSMAIIQPENMFDGLFSSGFMAPNGTVTASDSYQHNKNKIEVNANDTITFWYYSTSQQAMTSATVRFLTAFNAQNEAVSEAGSNTIIHEYTVPTGIKYIVFTYATNTTAETLMCIKGTDAPDEYKAYIPPYYVATKKFLNEYNCKKEIIIKNSDGIAGFYTKMAEAYNTGNCDVIIEQGTYTFTNELVESIRTAGLRGIPIGNGCRYYFNGAHIICNYTGENLHDVADMFSPLDAQNRASDFEIYNLDLLAKNCCYALHDDGNGGDFCRHIYQDCKLELDNSGLSEANGNPISKALGGGLAAHEEVIIRNCIFKATNPAHTSQYQNDASYHGANNSSFTDASIVIDGCYFQNIFRCSNLSANIQEPYPRIIYTNNSSSQFLVDLPGTWHVYKWNNELRT